MRIDVDKRAGKVALVEAIAARRFRVRNHTKRHAVGKRNSAIKRAKKAKAKHAFSMQKKYRAKFLLATRKYWSGEVDELGA